MARRGRPATATTALVPASARADQSLEDLEAVLNEEAVEVFAKAVGGRDKLADTLAVAGSGSAEIERVTTLLLDPRYKAWGLARLCTTVGITVAELFACYRKAMIVRAQIEATVHVAAALPAVARDVMDKALPTPLVCGLCQGTGTVTPVEPGQPRLPCPLCKGSGTVLSEPTVERHKLALELGQLLEKKGGLLIQQNNVAANLAGTGAGSLEQLQQAVGDVLFGGKRGDDAIDVEATDATPAELPDDDDDDEEELPTQTAEP